jgi:hypothetical protein
MLEAAAVVDFTSVGSYSVEATIGYVESANDTSLEATAELWRLEVHGAGEELQRFAVPIRVESTERDLGEVEAPSGYTTPPSQTSPASVSERSELASEILAYRHLHEDWDGEGGVPPSREAIRGALAFLELLPLSSKLPKTTVSGDGEVGFYWKTRSGYIDVGFLGDGYIRYFGRLGLNGAIARGPRPYSGLAFPRDLLDVIVSI